MIQSLPDDQLTHLVLTADDFNKARVDDHEVKVDGRMYDVARIRVENDTIHVYAVHDQSEDSLLGFLDTALGRLQNDTAQLPGSLIHFSLLQYIPVDFKLTISAGQSENIRSSVYQVLYSSIERPVDSPPPQA